MDNKDREYYKPIVDLIKNIIIALFVAELGMIGYFLRMIKILKSCFMAYF